MTLVYSIEEIDSTCPDMYYLVIENEFGDEMFKIICEEGDSVLEVLEEYLYENEINLKFTDLKPKA